jgi:hypothetical protein
MAKATVKDVKEFFGMTLGEMKDEWMGKGDGPKLSDQDKQDLMEGIGNGTLTY